MVTATAGEPVYASLADKAYAAIRDRLIMLDIPPMTAIDDVALAKSLDIGRTPVREALKPLEIDRLGFVHEDFFLGDSPAKCGKTVYEICFYYYMKTPADFEPVCRSFTEDGTGERLVWVPLDTPKRLYPGFFRTELAHPAPYIRHILTDERHD